MPRRATSDAGRPPRLVLRFAVLAATVVAAAAVAVLAFTDSYATDRAEDSARFHASFIAHSILSDGLRSSDFAAPVTASRRAQLDALFRRLVLGEDVLRAKLYAPDGVVTYSNYHSLIGTTPDADEVSDALQGEAVSHVSRLNAEGGSGDDLKVL